MATLVDTMDSLTLQAIVQLQLADTEELNVWSKGKQREGEITDAELALQLYTQDLQGLFNYVSDRRLAQSFTDAVLRDGDLIHQLQQQENQARRDHEVALRFVDNNGAAAQPSKSVPLKESSSDEINIWSDGEMLAKVAAIYMQDSPAHDERTQHDAESSTWAAARRSKPAPLRRCVACGDEFEFFDVARVPCDDEYCRACLSELFRLSMTDESLFPPRCCRQEIPLERVRFFLQSDLAKEFASKSVELGTRNRTYCFEPQCATFIPPDAVNEEIATCPVCRRTTCTMCKNASHSGDCPNDSALQQLLDIAETEQWQRCYSCKRLVELDVGCNHMR